VEPKPVGADLVTNIESFGLWAVMVGETIVPLVSLSPGALDALQCEFGVKWLNMLDAPLDRPALAEAFVGEAFDKLGVPRREFSDFRDMARLFVQIKSDLPESDPFAEREDDRANPT